MKKILLFYLSFVILPVWAKIEVTFTPNPVAQGDGVEMVLSSDKPFTNMPNIEVLQKDFVIGGQQQRQSSQWINGKGFNSYQLSYTLFPNKSGDIIVDDLQVGTEKLPATKLTVTADPTMPSQGNIEMTVDCPNTPIYQGQKILCTVVLDDTMGLVDGQIMAPASESGTWEQVLPPIPTIQTKQSSKYKSVFAFTPKQSGRIEVGPFVFEGVAKLNTRPKGRYNTIFDVMTLALKNTATQPAAAASLPFMLTIKEKPTDYVGWWLPSTDVHLSESYNIPENIAVGEPLTRTVILEADGVSADLLPVPTASQTVGLKVYANPEKRENTEKGAKLMVDITFVPTQSGEAVLPEITVPWFNTERETIEKAVLPMRTINVASEAMPENIIQTTQQAANPVPVVPTVTPVAAVPAEPVPQQATLLSLGWIVGLVAGAFLLGLGLCFTIMYWHNKRANAKAKKKPLPDLYPF